MQAGTIVGNLASAIVIPTEEAALVADLKAGSESAFALLIAQYHQPIYSLIARSLNDPADAAAGVVNVASVTRDDMHVDVTDGLSARHADVDADIVALRLIALLDRDAHGPE